ncbi:hypothetical protein GLOIN_2v1764020 [Rhizophagus irregularis DAOM 181602=DAOM 197198]|nr:hypothetical protein GLOIN_2v1764020 [Rhizophagus irregularis DAOM 181602=DAOM 197198]
MLIVLSIYYYKNDEQLKTFSYRELEILNIDCITLNTASSIIENTGGQLKEILSSKYYDTIYHDDFDEDSLNFIQPEDELLEIIIRSAPNNLSEIRFFDDIQFTLEELETFFDKWKGRPALSMFTSDSIYGEKEYVALIDRYKNDGVIKYFSYEKNIYFNMETETD